MAMKNSSHPWLPYLIAFIGILFSLVLWVILILIESPFRLLASFESALPWIILVLGISITVLVAVVVRLSQLTQQKTKSLQEVNEAIKKQISERIRAEETKQKLEKALLQGQKLQAIGTLAGGIAHDFNNLLYAIMGYVEMARDDVEKESITHKNLGKVLDASRRGQELIARILAFSRRQHHDLKPLHIQQTIESVLALLRPTIPASVVINFHPMASDHHVLGDQTRLHQVIMNIINNSVDAMDGEGTVTIELNIILANDPLLKEFPKIANCNYCRIDIKDTGHGMDLSTMERIFEPFYTTKEVGKGTGLGLSTVHAIIKEHKGEVMVDSQLGHGTTFTLLLPEYEPTIEEKETYQWRKFYSLRMMNS